MIGFTITVYGNVVDPRGTQRKELEDAVRVALRSAKGLRGIEVAVVEVKLHG